jgi:Kdo2-lipid IVA lauroyltransferase/acyltransferase
VNAVLTISARFLALFSDRAIVFFSHVLGWFWFAVLRYRRDVILENLTRAFPHEDARRLGLAACRHLVLTLFEFIRIPSYQARGLETVVRFEGLEHFETARAKGKGVLCLSGHLGSFELCVAAVAARARPVNLVVKPFPGGIDRFVNRVRRDAELGVISADGALRPILRALKNNESVVFVLDQNATRKIGVFVDFFGKPACTMSALATLAVRTGAAVIAATPYRDADGKHVLQVHPEIALEEKATRDETIVHMTQVYTRFLEDAIKRHPEQWFWTHKRWRTRPA